MASVDPGDVLETPVGDRGESFRVLDALIGIPPFVFLVGILSGIAAALAVWPVAATLGATRIPPGRDHSTYPRGPALVGGIGLLASVVVDVVRRVRPEGVGSALAGRLLLVGGCLAAVAHLVQYREAVPERRRTNGYAYVAFVVWTALVFGLYALWICSEPVHEPPRRYDSSPWVLSDRLSNRNLYGCRQERPTSATPSQER